MFKNAFPADGSWAQTVAHVVRVFGVVLSLGLMSTGVVQAQEADLSVLAEAAAEREPGWSGSVTANYYERRGNSR